MSIFKGAEFKSGIYFVLNAANSSGLNFQKYTPLAHVNAHAHYNCMQERFSIKTFTSKNCISCESFVYFAC